VIAGKTRVFAILGDPVAHSLSPTMHNAAFRALGLDAVYVAIRPHSDEVAPLMRALARAGGGGNVTIPHKEVALRGLTQPSATVAAMDACNTFWGQNGEIHGDNTDVEGLLAALAQLDAPRTCWLIAGTGGGSRAAVSAAVSLGARIAIRSRDSGRRHSFERWAQDHGAELVLPDV
jgi:shikimate dehydrogenase